MRELWTPKEEVKVIGLEWLLYFVKDVGLFFLYYVTNNKSKSVYNYDDDDDCLGFARYIFLFAPRVAAAAAKLSMSSCL